MDGTHKTWTTERIALLKNRIEAGFSREQIAREIGVSRNAVIGKANRLGLSRVKGPVRRLDPSAAKIARPRKATQRRILRALQANPQLDFGEMPGDYANRCSLLELQQWHCRWPISDPGAEDFGFCGNNQVKGLSYCAAHALVAYRPSTRERARVNDAAARGGTESELVAPGFTDHAHSPGTGDGGIQAEMKSAA
jgi:GcrA cell cycle regulator